MSKKHALLALACAGTLAGQALAAEGTVTWYDRSCGYFVMQLPEGSEGFGLYEWKSGSEPAVGDVIAGDILGGPELDVSKASGEALQVVHWGDAKSAELLIKYSPKWCKSKPKRRR